MGSLLNRVLMAYRPLYLRGLLMDGQYRLLMAPERPPDSPGGQRQKSTESPSRAAAPSGLAATAFIAAAARRHFQEQAS